MILKKFIRLRQKTPTFKWGMNSADPPKPWRRRVGATADFDGPPRRTGETPGFSPGSFIYLVLIVTLSFFSAYSCSKSDSGDDPGEGLVLVSLNPAEARPGESVNLITETNCFDCTAHAREMEVLSLGPQSVLIPFTDESGVEGGEFREVPAIMTPPSCPDDAEGNITLQLYAMDGDVESNNLPLTLLCLSGDDDDDDDSDRVPPGVTPITPTGTNTSVNSLVVVNFSEPMDPDTINESLTLQVGEVVPGIGFPFVTGDITYEGTTAVFDPSEDLDPGTTYTATVTTGATDIAGNALEADTIWAFKTSSAPGEDDDDAPDGPPLTVLSTEPRDGTTGIPINAVIGVTFSERADPATLNRDNIFFVSDDGMPIEWSVYGDYNFRSFYNLRYDTSYTFILTPGVTDIAGNPLERPYVTSFTTRSAPTVVDIGGGAFYSAAAMSDRTVRTCGAGSDGQLGYSTTDDNNPIPGQVNSLSNVVKICTGMAHTVALTHTGEVWAWGSNGECQLGTEDIFLRSAEPVRIGSGWGGFPITNIACGGYHTLALDSRGHVFAWGRGNYGQLGNGESRDSCLPVLVDFPGGAQIKEIAAGMSHSVALSLGTGRVYVWGDNDEHQLGSSGTGALDLPYQLPDLERIVHIAVGSYHTLVYKKPDLLFGWGKNNNGQVDHGESGRSHISSPTNIIPPTGVGHLISNLSAGETHTMALTLDGDVWAWGSNLYRQLSRGLFIRSRGPFQVNLPSPATAISAGRFHNLVLLEDGRVVSWGRNSFGGLCRETGGTPSSTPTLIDWYE